MANQATLLYRAEFLLDELANGAFPALLTLIIFWLLARRYPKRMTCPNFRGNRIPVIGGYPFIVLGFLIFYIGLLISSALRIADVRTLMAVVWALFWTLAGFGIVGLVDDLYGDRSTGGFRGHVSRFFKERRVTTGLIKIVAGGAIGLAAGYELSQPSFASESTAHWPELIIARNLLASTLTFGLFIALSANTVNLLDLRPGRAATVAAAILLLKVTFGNSDAPPMMLLGALIVVLIFDRSGRIMLGDAGANAIGAGLAVMLILNLPLWAIAFGVLLLAAFQIWCEKHSVSAFIEAHPVLRSIDRKIGIR